MTNRGGPESGGGERLAQRLVKILLGESLESNLP